MSRFNPTSMSKWLAALKRYHISNSVLAKVLPSWWNDDMLATQSGSLQLALLIKSRLGLHVTIDDDGAISIDASARNVEFKKRMSTSMEKLAPVAAIGHGIATTITSILEGNRIERPTRDDVNVRLQSLENVTLNSLVSTLWSENIPVFYLDSLPSSLPRPAGMIVNIDGYICIILAHKDKSPSAQAFVVSHEIGHYVHGHMEAADMLTDVRLSELDDSLAFDKDAQELEADHFALSLMRGGQSIENFMESVPNRPSVAMLAQCANQYGIAQNIIPGHLVLSYARESGDWATSRSALKFLENNISAKEVVLGAFWEGVRPLSIKREELDYLKRMQGI